MYDAANRYAGRDGTIGRSTVILSEEAIINDDAKLKAAPPSRRNIRAWMTELLDHAKNVRKGDAFLVDRTSHSVRFDIRGSKFHPIYVFLEEENIVKFVGMTPMNFELRLPGPGTSPKFLASAELDLISALRLYGLNTQIRLNRPSPGASSAYHYNAWVDACLKDVFKPAISTGILRTPDRKVMHVKAGHIFQVLASRLPVGPEIDKLAERYMMIAKVQDERHDKRRTDTLALFTSGRCITATLAEQLGNTIRRNWNCGKCRHCIAGSAPLLVSARPVEAWRLENTIQAVPERFRRVSFRLTMLLFTTYITASGCLTIVDRIHDFLLAWPLDRSSRRESSFSI